MAISGFMIMLAQRNDLPLHNGNILVPVTIEDYLQYFGLLIWSNLSIHGFITFLRKNFVNINCKIKELYSKRKCSRCSEWVLRSKYTCFSWDWQLGDDKPCDPLSGTACVLVTSETQARAACGTASLSSVCSVQSRHYNEALATILQTHPSRPHGRYGK